MYSFYMEVFRIAKQDDVPINEQINYEEVMVIGPNGEKLGIKPIKDALIVAEYSGLDLVLMSTQGMPVCKLMDYSKFKYEKNKKKKELQKKQREQNLETKEYRLSVTIDKHDFDTRLRNARSYLEKGHKIKLSLRFKGRQIAHSDLGKEVLLRFASELEDIGKIIENTKLEGRIMSLLIAPKNKEGK